MSRIGDAINLIGSALEDSEELARAKRLLVVMSFMIQGLSVIWITLYWTFDEPLAASIPGLYVVVSSISMVVFSRRGD